MTEQILERLETLIHRAQTDKKAKQDLLNIYAGIPLAEGQASARAGFKVMPSPFKVCKCGAIYEQERNGVNMCPICVSRAFLSDRRYHTHFLQVMKKPKDKDPIRFAVASGYGPHNAVGMFGSIAMRNGFKHWVSVPPLGYYENKAGDQLYVTEMPKPKPVQQRVATQRHR